MIRLALLVALLTTGCVSFTLDEYNEVRQMRVERVEQEQRKNPWIAGVLNLTGGFGNFYLAAGTMESGQWAYGLLNILGWPFSPIWSIPQAAIDADRINWKETVWQRRKKTTVQSSSR